MTIKKTVRPVNLPGVHPGLMERLREAEQAEIEGKTPRQLDGAQKILRPALEASTEERSAQARAIGLVEPAWRIGADGRFVLADTPAYKSGLDLDRAWDQLSEEDKIRAGATERFRLEMEATLGRAAATYEPPHKLGGRLDARNLSRAQDNLRAEIDAYGELIAEDSRALLERFVEETRAHLAYGLRTRQVAGIETPALHAILFDWVQKLIYQELVSRRRGMGDRGIRRIAANIELAERVYRRFEKLPGYDVRQRLLMRLIHVHQDLGHTAYAARVSYRGSKLHRAYGARIFTDEINRYRALFSYEELELARTAVVTHSDDELPYKEARVLALVRAVDHLAPLAPHRVWMHLAGITGARPYLDDMLERVRAGKVEQFVALREHLGVFLTETGMPPALRDDVVASFRAFDRLAEPIELGALAGVIEAVDYDLAESPGCLSVRVRPEPFAERYQVLFDVQQDQLLRFARACGVADAGVRAFTAPLRLAASGSGAIEIAAV